MKPYTKTQPYKKPKSMYGRPKTHSPFPSNCFDQDKKLILLPLDVILPCQGKRERSNKTDMLNRLNERGKSLKVEIQCKAHLPLPQTQGRIVKEQENNSYKLTFYNPKVDNQNTTVNQEVSFESSPINILFPFKYKAQITYFIN